jgi:hypothetical protein
VQRFAVDVDGEQPRLQPRRKGNVVGQHRRSHDVSVHGGEHQPSARRVGTATVQLGIRKRNTKRYALECNNEAGVGHGRASNGATNT